MRGPTNSKTFWRHFHTALFCEENKVSTAEGLQRARELKQRAAEFDKERREFLKAAGALSIVGATGLVLPFGRAHAANPGIADNKNLRIAIVGAGLAGLACADVLIKQGFSPVLFDARKYVGGRCSSLRPNGLSASDLNDLHGPNAAHYLVEPGWNGGNYERDSTGHFQVGERGGEFIDTAHHTMRNYATEFKLAVEDINKAERAGEDYHYYGIGNPITPKLVPESDVVNAIREFVPQFSDSLKSLTPPTAVLAEQGKISDADKALDKQSLAQFLESKGQGNGTILRSMAQENYANEFGEEIDNLSVLAWLLFAHADRSSKFRPYGILSDERFHVKGGNDLIPLNIARRVDGGVPGSRIKKNHFLKKVEKTNGGKIKLHLQDDNGKNLNFDPYDIVVFALPFSTLRYVEGIGRNPGNSNTQGTGNHIDLSKVTPTIVPVMPGFNPSSTTHNPLGLTVHKLRAIHNLDYGHSSKIHYAFRGPVWRKHGSSGVTFSDRDAWPDHAQITHNTTWESNHTQAILDSDALGRSPAAILTDYIGGDRAKRIAAAGYDFQAETSAMVADLDRIFITAGAPGPAPISSFLRKDLSGKNIINAVPWFSDPFVKGSYVNNMPNYFIQIANFEGVPDGAIKELFPSVSTGPGNWRVFFAGEHCSPFFEWQGFLEGAALSGIRAANDILAALKAGKIPV